jgi:ribosome-binding protein aMBF1 (putative translation factor)
MSTELSVLPIQSIGHTDYTFQTIRRKISHRIRMSAAPTNHLPDCPKNLVGPQIRRCRNARGWSQAKLALRLQLDGLDISREVLAQMECQIHCVRDNHIFHLARALAVNVSDFFAGLEK